MHDRDVPLMSLSTLDIIKWISADKGKCNSSLPFLCCDLLAQQVFEAGVQFYVILVQVTKELISAKNLRNADQLEWE